VKSTVVVDMSAIVTVHITKTPLKLIEAIFCVSRLIPLVKESRPLFLFAYI
jgi:hypothetical protein